MEVEALASVEGATAGASVGAQKTLSVFLQASITHFCCRSQRHVKLGHQSFVFLK